jgi:hypothetical protein
MSVGAIQARWCLQLGRGTVAMVVALVVPSPRRRRAALGHCCAEAHQYPSDRSAKRVPAEVRFQLPLLILLIAI